MNRYLPKLASYAAVFAVSALNLPGQETAPSASPPTTGQPAAATSAGEDEEETIVLSPFEVDAAQEDSYAAQYTLAGTRIRTDIKDVGSSISVITSKFLEDTGTTNATQLLVYTPSTEVNGPSGNFLGSGDDVYAGAIRYGVSRVRGLADADRTRDFFLTEIDWDNYNTGRIDIQRGPNSILFGIGSPAGIVNGSINKASFAESNQIQNKLDNFGTVRFSADFDKVLIDNELAVRVALLDDATKYRQKPAFRDDKRAYGAIRWDPSFLNNDSMHTSIEATYEHGNIESNLPRQAPPNDYLTPWFYSLRGFQDSGVKLRDDGRNQAAYLGHASDQLSTGGLITTYLQGEATGINYPHNLSGGNGQWVGTSFVVGITGYALYAKDAGVEGYTLGAFKNNVLRDSSVFDYYNILLDGPTKGEFNDFDAYNVAIRQSFMDDTFGYELVFDEQKVHSGGHSFLNSAGYGIGIDVMGTYAGGIIGGSPNPAGGVFEEVPDPVNPNLGRAYVVGARGSSWNWRQNRRTSYRATGYYNLDFRKIAGRESKLGWILGENRFTGLLSRYRNRTFTGSGGSYRSDDGYEPNLPRTNDDGTVTYPDNGSIVYLLDYLSPRRFSGDSPSGINLPGLSGLPNLSQGTINLFDSETASFHEASFNLIPNFDRPERERDYSNASLGRRTVDTAALVWQGYWLDGNVIPLAAIRKDSSFFNDGVGLPREKNTANTFVYPFDSAYQLGEKGPTANVTSKTYSIVTHTPKSWRDKLPGHMDFQLIYNQSENFQPSPGRVDILNRPIPDPSGETTEYGFAVSALDNKLYMKVVHYETKGKGVNVGLQGNLGAFGALEVWARCCASIHAGNKGAIGTGGDEWQADTTYGISSDGGILTFKPAGPWAADLNSGQTETWQGLLPNEPAPPGTIRQSYTQAEIDAEYAHEQAVIQAVLNNPPPDAFLDAMGIPKDVFFSPEGPGMWDYSGSGGSASADITGDTVSKGTEIELTANPIAGLSLMLNVTHSEAKRVSVAQSFLDYLDERRPFFYGLAGDIRLWTGGWDDHQNDPYTSAGNATAHIGFRTEVDSKIALFLASTGTKVPELKPWAFNFVGNYAFQNSSLRGINVGMAYRWLDKNVTGYPITYDENGFEAYDIQNPYYGSPLQSFDFWVGYQRQLTEKLSWRVQLNVRNAFTHDDLIRTAVNPDGTPAVYRIPEPRTFTLTNTISF